MAENGSFDFPGEALSGNKKIFHLFVSDYLNGKDAIKMEKMPIRQSERLIKSELSLLQFFRSLTKLN